MSVVVGVLGAKRVGKDTLSKKVIEFNSDFVIDHFADDLKHFLSKVFEIPEIEFHDDVLKERIYETPIEMDKYIEAMSDITGLKIQPRGLIAVGNRTLAQYFGTEYVRLVQDNYWVERVQKRVNASGRPTLISDTRFLNEAAVVRSYQSNLIVRLIRDDVPVDPKHPSESESLLIKEDLIFKSEKGVFYLTENYTNISILK
jgi:hypothetical protein